MTFPHFLLPRLPPCLFTYLDVQEMNTIPLSVINESLSYYLNDIKHQIEAYEHQWEVYKKYTNTYEYIHTLIPYKKYCISKYRPLSRSFFKMIELLHFFGLNMDQERPIYSFHLAEGPGGFIEALVKYRANPQDRYIGMTLLDPSNNNYDIPAWKKSQSFLHANPNVTIETGYDKTGNILSLDNFVYMNKMYGGMMDLVTADGGFDFSKDFENQEMNMVQLLFGQIAFALCMQKQGGCFVLKVFDMFMQHSIDLLALLSSLYERVYVTKPNTSRPANSEKYIVCKGYLLNSSYRLYPFLHKTFRRILDIGHSSSVFVHRLFMHSVPIHYHFLNKLEEANVVLGQSQIENIYLTLSYIINESVPDDRGWDKNEIILGGGENPRYVKTKVHYLMKSNIQKCIQWCIEHNVSYNY